MPACPEISSELLQNIIWPNDPLVANLHEFNDAPATELQDLQAASAGHFEQPAGSSDEDAGRETSLPHAR